MKLEADGISFEQLLKKIKLAIAIALILGGSYLGIETFLIVKSVLVEPVSLKKWVELRPTIMMEPKFDGENAKQKSPVNSETELLTLWVALGYFSIVLGILYSYILIKISLGLLQAGITILMSTIEKKLIKGS